MHDKGSIIADRFKYKTWIKEFLLPDIQEQFPDLKVRVLCTGYETKTTQALLDYFNIQDRDVDAIADELLDNLKSCLVGDKPTIFVGFSMGGMITKLILLNDPEISKSTKNILFIGTPHRGSDVLEDTRAML